jgi:hypothetical protein
MKAQTILLAALFLSSLKGAEWHVSQNGKDSNSGNAAAPFRTIQHAAEAAQLVIPSEHVGRKSSEDIRLRPSILASTTCSLNPWRKQCLFTNDPGTAKNIM